MTNESDEFEVDRILRVEISGHTPEAVARFIEKASQAVFDSLAEDDDIAVTITDEPEKQA
jgi:hypothetical protein